MKSLIGGINKTLERHGFAIHTHPKGFSVYRKGVVLGNMRLSCGEYLPGTFTSIRAALDGITKTLKEKP